MREKGTLYVCATPIGNLGDITLRVLDTLRQADLVAAEDTRHSRKLLQYYDIHTPLTSYHEHNEKSKAYELVEKLKAGQTVALISDAGLPGISDPGSAVIRLCYEENIAVDVLPGPNAALTALVLSGLPTDRFAFQGFLSAHKNERRKVLAAWAQLPLTQIFYEAPHRLGDTLQDLLEIWGERQGAVVRELTKIHQTVHRGMLTDLAEEFRDTPAKGECCLVLAPHVPVKPVADPAKWRQEVQAAVTAGTPKQQAIKEVARRFGVGKREVYRALLEMESTADFNGQ